MASGQSVWRVVVPTAVTAGVSTGLAVAVNYATGGDRSVWMWVAVVVLTVGFSRRRFGLSGPSPHPRRPQIR